MTKKIFLRFVVGTAISAAVVAFALSWFMPWWQSLRIGFGLGFLYMPGYIWTYYFWPARDIAEMERLVVALILSIILVPMTVLVTVRLGLALTPLTLILCSVLLIIAGVISQKFRVSHSSPRGNR